jgi:hypothetical protein
VKNILVQIGNVLRTRDFWIRVLFVVIAAFFWLLIKLSKGGYVSELQYPVEYENLPTSKVMVKAPPKNITLRVSSYGFRLLGYELKNSKPLQIDVKRNARQLEKDKNIYYFLPNLYREELQTQLDAQATLLRIEPDTVFFVLSDRVKKRVPVVSEVVPQFANGYRQIYASAARTQSCYHLRPIGYIDSIAYVKTVATRLEGINRDVAQQVEIDFEHPLIVVNSAQSELPNGCRSIYRKGDYPAHKTAKHSSKQQGNYLPCQC